MHRPNLSASSHAPPTEQVPKGCWHGFVGSPLHAICQGQSLPWSVFKSPASIGHNIPAHTSVSHTLQYAHTPTPPPHTHTAVARPHSHTVRPPALHHWHPCPTPHECCHSLTERAKVLVLTLRKHTNKGWHTNSMVCGTTRTKHLTCEASSTRPSHGHSGCEIRGQHAVLISHGCIRHTQNVSRCAQAASQPAAPATYAVAEAPGWSAVTNAFATCPTAKQAETIA